MCDSAMTGSAICHNLLNLRSRQPQNGQAASSQSWCRRASFPLYRPLHSLSCSAVLEWVKDLRVNNPLRPCLGHVGNEKLLLVTSRGAVTPDDISKTRLGIGMAPHTLESWPRKHLQGVVTYDKSPLYPAQIFKDCVSSGVRVQVSLTCDGTWTFTCGVI